MIKIYLPLLALSLNVSCEKLESDAETKATMDAPTSPFFGASDFTAPASVETLDAAALKEEISGNTFLFEKPDTSISLTQTTEIPQSSTEGELAEEACITDLFKSAVIKAEGSKFTYAAAYDLTPCLGTMETSPDSGYTQKIIESTIKLYVEFTCEGDDLSALNGKSPAELEGFDESCKTTSTNLSNMSSTTKVEVTANGKTSNYESTSTSSISTPENTACTTTVEGTVASLSNTCQQVERSSMSMGNSTSNQFFKTLSRDLKWDNSSASSWFASGSMDVVINNWSGTVSFNGLNPPTYSLSNGTETVAATISHTMSLATQSMRAQIRSSQLGLKARIEADLGLHSDGK